MKHHLALLPLVVAAVTALPAAAMADEGFTFDLRYAYELQTWSVPGTSGTPLLTFSAPMHTYTVTDHSGMVLALGASVARTQGSKMMAEQEARRRKETTYTYSMYQAEPKEGLRLGMTVGTGAPAGLASPGFSSGVPAVSSARLFRLFAGSDLFPLFTGTFAWEVAANSFSVAQPTTGPGFSFSSTQLPLGLSYRLGLPMLPVLLEPYARLDLAHWMGNGFTSFKALDYGLTAALVLHPQWRLEGRFQNASLPQSGAPGSTAADLASLSTLALGTTMYF